MIGFDSPVYRTAAGTRYLKGPGVALIGRTSSDLSGAQAFLDGFGPDAGFSGYTDDPTYLPGGERLVKFSGQLCYLSLGKGRSVNADAPRYFDNIKEQGHGSVLEHASFSFLCWGIDRAVTHELVRHRAGAAYSQVSQRFVDGTTLRFVERPEYQGDGHLHAMFEDWIDRAAQEYHRRAVRLLGLQAGGEQALSGDKARDRRKKVNQSARACLPNEAEAPIVCTFNARALRHVVEMRAHPAADVTIRALAVLMLKCARMAEPLLFSDHEVATLPDGTEAVSTPWRKV